MSSKPLRADARRNRDRILAAAEEVFARHGASASTEEVAAIAGVAIGTVFRHFPTKQDLLAAIVKELLARLTAEVAELASADPATALFDFVERVVEQAAEKRAVVELLAADGVRVGVADPLRGLADALGVLLSRAQQAGAVRAEIRLDEVLALLTATAQGALHGGWSEDLRRRALAVVFAGMRP
ncbi:TetR/AcrR family transcriptional regulator [Actinophytocola xanthii]|uniref:TetR/AcrR family transcriptional regulator n=1 Tax=Actinophytocola xanthii TaxID=1912961 RepID=UPI000B177362